MGVKGLTSFIAKNAEQYMTPFELHDCDLVIDGDNLACNLYKNVSNCNSAFGGDYDEYYRTVVNFFKLLSQCNIRSFVVLDGGYEQKKIKTVQSRLRCKIGSIKHINPSNSKPMFPLMMREVFVDALRDTEVNFIRCMFEADDELAALAKYLNCPVLSYDSDFYIFNVKYIPLITLRMKVLEKKENKMNQRKELRICEARNLRKKHQMNGGGQAIVIDHITKVKNLNVNTVKYLDCCLYKIENLLEKGRLDKEKLPLFAALLGNDYINPRLFRNFYSQVGMKGIPKKIPKHQKRVMAILKWLRHESKESAIEKILIRMKKEKHGLLLKQIDAATNGYLNKKSVAINYFKLTENDRISEESEEEDSNEDSMESDIEETEDDEIDFSEAESVSSESSNEFNEDVEETELHSSTEFQIDDKNSLQQQIADDNFPINNNETKEEIKLQNIPDDILNKIYSGVFPRYINDLLNLNLYINNPQVENFLFPDCNEIAIPILLKIFAYLHFPEKPDLKYLTRVVRLTNCIYKKFSITELIFNKENILEDIFSRTKVNLNDLIEDLQSYPADIKYYLISLVYWANKSKYCDDFHIHAILICLVTLRFIDTKIDPIRNEKQFYKVHGKKIQKDKQLRNKMSDLNSTETSIENNNSKSVQAKNLLNQIDIYERINFIPKIEIILLQENLLKFFSYRENNRKSHTTFSSTIIHGFSEFQSVIYQMYTLNSLLNYNFEQIKMPNLYSGIFLFNIYANLQQRIDIQHHIKNFIFRNSEVVYEFYQTIGKICEKYIKTFEMTRDAPEIELSKKIKKKIAQKNKKNNKKTDIVVENTSDMISNKEFESEDEVNLINNKFGLLNVR